MNHPRSTSYFLLLIISLALSPLFGCQKTEQPDDRQELTIDNMYQVKNALDDFYLDTDGHYPQSMEQLARAVLHVGEPLINAYSQEPMEAIYGELPAEPGEIGVILSNDGQHYEIYGYGRNGQLDLVLRNF